MERIKKWVFPFIDISRPPLDFMGVCLATCGVVIALNAMGNSLPIVQCILGAIAVFITTGGMHTINDYFDRLRDHELWPDRPIPSGKLRPLHALAFALGLFTAGLTLILVLFNPVCFTVVLVTITLGVVYSRYLRDRVGYLSLAPIIGLFPVGGYAAFAGNEVFFSLAPWMLFFMVTLWQAGHILVYSPAHGVTMKERETKTVVPAFLVALSPRATAFLGAIFFGALLILSLCLYLVVPLSLAYLLVVVASGGAMIILSLKLAANPIREISIMTFQAASLYAIILFSAIALDIFFRFLFLSDFFSIFIGFFALLLIGFFAYTIIRGLIGSLKNLRTLRKK